MNPTGNVIVLDVNCFDKNSNSTIHMQEELHMALQYCEVQRKYSVKYSTAFLCRLSKL